EGALAFELGRIRLRLSAHGRLRDTVPFHSLRHHRRSTLTALRSFLVQMQRRANFLGFQHPPQPSNLVRRSKKRVLAVDGRVVPPKDIFDLADCFRGGVLDSLDMEWHEPEMIGIDVPRLDESPGLLWTAAGVVLIHQPTLVVHEAVKVAA